MGHPLSSSTALVLAVSGALLTACGGDPAQKDACGGLRVVIRDQSIRPPANVALLAEVTDCERRPLGRRLGESSFEIAEGDRLLTSYEARRMIVPAERKMTERVLLALDLSGPIMRSGLRAPMIESAKRLVRGLSANHEIAVYGFDGRVELIPFSYFSKDEATLDSALDHALESPLVDESTNLNGAIAGALEVLERAVAEDERDLYTVSHGSLVVFTEGRDLAGRVSGAMLAQRLQMTRQSTFAIGVGPSIDEAALARVARTGRFRTPDAQGVFDAFSNVSAALKARAESNYVVSYCSPARAGIRTAEITVKHDLLVGRAKLMFNADRFGSGCTPDSTSIH